MLQLPKPKAFDLLMAVANFARQHSVALNDPTLIERFVADARPRLEAALADPTLIHGSRTEKLFEAVLLSLGRFRLLKAEDVGRVHSTLICRAPDFRVVLDDGEQWLIEIKNVRTSKPFKQQTRMSSAYLSSLQTYADAVGLPLKLAVFWSLWNIWTVISPQRFQRPDGGLRVTMREAVMHNEFGRLGEIIVMTKPPLRLVLDAKADMPRSLSPEGLASFIIDSSRMFSGDVELCDPQDRELAEKLFLYGDWTTDGPFAIMDGEEITGVEFVSRPEEPSDQCFDGIGWASRIFGRYFAAQTTEGKEVIQLNGSPAPDWFAPLATWPFETSKLPLWLGRIESPLEDEPAVEE